MLGDPRQHLGADFFVVVKGERHVRRSFASQRSMRTGLTLDGPADTKERCQDSPRLGRAPSRHAALKVTLRRSGAASLCSRRSASTRRASAWTWAIASSLLFPYVMTPGRSGTSAIHRPSSSRSSSILKFILEE